MQGWLPFSQRPPAAVMTNYNPFFSPNNAGYYAIGGQVHVRKPSRGSDDSDARRSMVNANPLQTPGYTDFPDAYEALQYGFGKGVHDAPLRNIYIKQGRTIQQIREMDASNYYNFVK
jgi:hypothetical protein